MTALEAMVDELAQTLEVSPARIRSALERLEAEGLIELRVVDVAPETPSEEMAAIRQAGRAHCLCSLDTVERVIMRGGTCGRGGCPYGGDL